MLKTTAAILIAAFTLAACEEATMEKDAMSHKDDAMMSDKDAMMSDGEAMLKK